MMVGIREQVHIALDESDVILFVVDSHTGLAEVDKNMFEVLRQTNKPVFIVANKSDNENYKLMATEFYELGVDQVFPVSATNGTGTGELLDEVVIALPPIKEDEHPDLPKVAIVGRPNVGKSSYVNALLGTSRSIVTDIAGTTRDSINSIYDHFGKEMVLIDTAGLRKKAKVKENIEFYSTVRTEKAIRECDVAVVVLDATRGLEDQDKRILRLAEEFNKGVVIALNKWDLIEDKETNTFKEYEQKIREQLFEMDFVPIISISAVNRQRTTKLIELVLEVIEERKKRIATSAFNSFLEKTLQRKPMPVKRGRQLNINYALQVKENPPVFKFFMNIPEELPANYRRFLEKQIREEFGFKGVPITMVFRQK
jgi:GTP-binding protein